jgi:MFS family permease
LAAFLHFSSLYALLATLPLYVVDLGGSAREVGLLTGVFALTSLVARPWLGAWMDRAGRRRFLVAGAGIYVVASLGYAAIASLSALLWWRAFHALGLAAFSTAAAALAGDLAPERGRGRTMGLYGLAQTGAMTVAPGLGSVAQAALGYRGLFAATAGAALGALGCALAVRPPGPAACDAAPSPRAGPPERAGLAGPAVAQFAASVAYGTVVTFVAVVARDRALPLTGWFFALLALSSLSVRLAAGRLYDTWGPRPGLAPAFLFVAAGLWLLASADRPASFLAAGVLAGLGIGGAHTTLLAHVVDHAGAGARGRRVAAFTACWELGVGLGTILTGRLAEVAGYPAMFLGVAALSLLGLASLPWLRR